MKYPWQSRTMLLNGLAGIIAFVALFIPAASGLETFIQAHAVGIASVWSVANIALRAVTKDKIGLGE